MANTARSTGDAPPRPPTQQRVVSSVKKSSRTTSELQDAGTPTLPPTPRRPSAAAAATTKPVQLHPIVDHGATRRASGKLELQSDVDRVDAGAGRRRTSNSASSTVISEPVEPQRRDDDQRHPLEVLYENITPQKCARGIQTSKSPPIVVPHPQLLRRRYARRACATQAGLEA